MQKPINELHRIFKVDRYPLDISNTLIEEPIAFKVKAEPGWSAVVFVVYNDELTCDVDYIPIDEWGFMSYLRLSDTQIEEYNRALLRHDHEVSMPIIPVGYNGVFSEFFNKIRQDFSNWNGIIPRNMLYGAVGPNNKISIDEMRSRCLSSFKKRKDIIGSIQSPANLLSNPLIKQIYDELGKIQSVEEDSLSLDIDSLFNFTKNKNDLN